MSNLVITGVIDGGLTGGLPKAIQLFVKDDIADLSIYALGSPNNGAAGGAIEFSFPAGPAAAGTTLYVASEADQFEAFFGFAPNAIDGVANNNGDDAIELFENGAVVDVFGAVGTVGSGEVWEYTDGWASRAPEAAPSTTFDPADWTFSGINALDGVATNASAPQPFPMPGEAPAPSVAINEYRISAPGDADDTSNFVELVTTPGASLEGLTLLAISGEFEPGQIDDAIDLSGAVADEDGFVLIANDANPALGAGDVGVEGLNFFGSPQTFVVVEGFTGAAGDDLDTDNDGTPDVTPWDAVLADLSGVDGDDRPDFSYSETVIPGDGNFPAAGAAREEDGTGDFAPLPFGDQSGDTPGATNTPSEPAPRVTIMEIQGAGHVSGLVSDTPLDPTTGGGSGPRVTTGGIVTAVDSNGFYLQDAEGDGDIATSDAIFVFTGSTPTVAVGDALDVTGTVSEFYPGGAGTGNLSTTQLGGNPEITVLSSGNALPASTLLGATGRVLPTEDIDDDAFASFDPTADGIDFWESLEGMLVTAVQPVAVSGTNGFGEVFTVLDGGDGATGLSGRGTLNISPDDFNPEKVQIDWDFGLPEVQVSTGAMFDDVVGVVTYNFGNYEIAPTEQVVVLAGSELEPEVTELAAGENQLTVASYNVLNLDPVVEEQALTNNGEARNVDDDIGDGRFAAIAEQIVNNLGTPDIIGLQEIQDNTGGETGDGVVSASETFETLIDAIDLADDGEMNDSSTYAFIDNTFIEDLASGGQPGGNIRTGFLYNTARVDLIEGSVRTIGSQDEGGAFEGGRLPLVATFGFNGEEVTVVNNHFSSKGGSAPIFGVEQNFADRQEDVEVNGSLDERRVQSEAVAGFVEGVLDADADANVVVLGDLNEFEFVSPLTNLEEAGLTNLTNTLDANERYSFNFQGNSQSLDHILVSGALAGGAQFDAVHVNSEFAETPSQASDHDPLVAQLTIGETGPATVEVAIDLEERGRLKSSVVESIDGEVVDTDNLGLLRPIQIFDDAGFGMRAEGARGPGSEKIIFLDGEMGVFSRDEPLQIGKADSVNGDEKLGFRVLGKELGDALEVEFDFGTVSGDGEVEIEFFDGRTKLDTRTYEITDGLVNAGLDGMAFDAVRIAAVDDTAFTLDGVAFDRLVLEDGTLLA
ncbi:endonuclease/exonuclease/phosphatase family protein [Jannaschia formosa]|uniref:endonuclease/exonuclease/phosphatase family protein n=1 Tax=Jannaschia formosa TaxID=2259592 RepID=UPI000E1BE2B3|nr:endonuclease/exonuclease/phosphatase family protein [Jannaschia formosa]TFL19258.1 endonuclease [Jannaschia formosa]